MGRMEVGGSFQNRWWMSANEPEMPLILSVELLAPQFANYTFKRFGEFDCLLYQLALQKEPNMVRRHARLGRSKHDILKRKRHVQDRQSRTPRTISEIRSISIPITRDREFDKAAMTCPIDACHNHFTAKVFRNLRSSDGGGFLNRHKALFDPLAERDWPVGQDDVTFASQSKVEIRVVLIMSQTEDIGAKVILGAFAPVGIQGVRKRQRRQDFRRHLIHGSVA